jgi:hypothetical protein
MSCNNRKFVYVYVCGCITGLMCVGRSPPSDIAAMEPVVEEIMRRGSALS